MSACTCDMRPPRYEHATMKDPFSKYVIRIDEIHDDSVIDPTCPFHGEGGSMVSSVRFHRAQD